ncbi:uncharacterized protein [Linepithema humile]|uniref:uncharacterized protein n=1 Tax=Linepithema humile TaxID=83485 RepID=UPI00351E4DE9
MSQDNDGAQISQVAVRVPPFWPEEPELWFAQLEGQFLLGGIMQDATKYAYAISQIDTKHAREIKDVITSPPANGKYETVKNALIQRLSISQEQRIRQLLEREEMGDRKPAQFLRHLKTLAGATVPDQLLKTLWMGRLPAQLQAILAARIDDQLEDIAEQADRIHEVTCRAIVAVTTPTSNKEDEQETLGKQVQKLTKQLAALNTRLSRQEQQTRHARKQSRSRTRKRDEDEDKSMCYYHRRFGDQAKKCTTPCTYKAKKSIEEN